MLTQAIARAGLTSISLTRFPVAIRLYSVPQVGGAMLTGRLLECLFLPCATILFVLMDCFVVTAPRMRCVLALTLLFHMSVELLFFQNGGTFVTEQPLILETLDDVGLEIARKIDFSLLLILLGATISTLLHPNSMTFITLPVDLEELVLYDTGVRRLKDEQLSAEKQYLASREGLEESSQGWLGRESSNGALGDDNLFGV